jgi:ribonuclease-3
VLVRRLFDPLMEAASRQGAALDWKTALQELTAAQGLGVPDYVIGESGPDHAKRFTRRRRVAGAVRGAGEGRSKKEAEQQAAEAAWRARRRPRGAARRRQPCPSCPRSRSSAAAWSAASSAAPSPPSRSPTRAPYAATPPGADDFAAGCRPDRHGRRAPRQVPLAAARLRRAR